MNNEALVSRRIILKSQRPLVVSSNMPTSMELKAHARSKSPNLKTSPSIQWVKRGEMINCTIAAAKRKNERGLVRVYDSTGPKPLSFFFYPPLLWRCLLSHFVLLIEHLAQATQFDSRRTKHGRIQQNNNCDAARSDKIIQVSLNKNTYLHMCP